MEFLFKPQATLDKSTLAQGDLLSRTPVLRDALLAGHRYYAEATDYTHFMVLTQSCDLVRRGKSPPKSRYITLAAVRPMSLVMERHRARQSEKIEGLPIPVYSADRKIFSSQLLERLLHNTEDGLFFIRKDSVEGVTQDLCAFLPLSVALKADDHYDALASSKIAELEDIFAAKVGWLAGNLYSRIGTPDFEEKVKDPDKYKKGFVDEFLEESAVWLTSLQLRWLKEEVKKWKKARPQSEMTIEEANELVGSTPLPEIILAENIIRVLQHAKLIDDGKVPIAANRLASDRVLKSVAKQASGG